MEAESGMVALVAELIAGPREGESAHDQLARLAPLMDEVEHSHPGAIARLMAALDGPNGPNGANDA